MSKKIIFILFSLIQLFSISLYAVGFFTIREQIPDSNNLQFTEQPQTDKVIFLLVDALKFDFANFNQTQANLVEQGLQNSNIYNQNQFPVIQQRLENEPQNTLFFKSIADSPTVTMQRIKAFITGNLPSFIDQANNFQAGELIEDNLLYQSQKKGFINIFMGDDTWMGLLPFAFKESYPFDSFNVMDLDSVDDGVQEHLFPAIEKNEFNFLIGHFLGVDHVGHTFDDNNKNMEEKLNQISDIINNTIEKMSDDTILIVVSDHGMTEIGNHGGSTQDEIETVLFSYSKKGFNQNLDFKKFDKNYEKVVEQIDIVPTISMLLGIPIPFNNLGEIIPDFILSDNDFANSNICSLYYKNLEQIINYISKIQEQFKKFDQTQYQQWNTEYEKLKIEFKNLPNDKDQQLQFVNNVQILIKDIKTVCRKVWNDFNTFDMYLAKILMVMIIIFYVLYENILFDSQPEKCSYKNFDKVQILDSDNITDNFFQNMKRKKILFVFSFIISTIAYIIFNLTIMEIIAIFLILCILIFYFAILQRSIYLAMMLPYVQDRKAPEQEIQEVNKQRQKQKQNFKYNNLIFYLHHFFHAYMMLALGHLRQEELSISELIMFTLFFTAKVVKDSQQIQEKNSIYQQIIVFVVFLYLGSYYDINKIKKYFTEVKFSFINKIININLIKFTIPAVLFYLYWKKKNNFNNKYMKLLFNIHYVWACLNVLLHEQFELNSDFVKYTMPKITYLLFFILLILSQFKQIQQNSIFLSIITMPIMLIMGKNGLPLLCIFFFLLEELQKIYIKIYQNSNLSSFYSYVALVTSYFFLITGHRAQTEAIQFLSAYVGLKEFHLFFSVLIVTINTFSPQILSIIWMASQNKDHYKQVHKQKQGYQIVNKQQQINYSQQNKFYTGFMQYNFHFYIVVVATTFNCTYNLDHLLLVEDFAPRFMFDFTGYLITSILIIIVFLIPYNRFQIK